MEISGYDLEDLEIENIGNWPFVLRIAVILGVCFATIFVGYWFIISDKMAQVEVSSKKMETELSNFTTAQKRIASLDAYKQAVKSMETELDDLIKQLPSSSAEANLLDEISQQAGSNGLQIVIIKPSDPVNKIFYVENPIEFTLSGSYQGMGGFISNVSNMTRMVTFDNFEIKESDKTLSGAKGPLTLVVDAKTYWVTDRGINKK